MTTADNLSRADPTDLAALRKALAASDPDGKLNSIQLASAGFDSRLYGYKSRSSV